MNVFLEIPPQILWEMSDSVSMASKEAVPHSLETEKCLEVAVSFKTILQRCGHFSMSSMCDCSRFRLFTNEMSVVSLLFVRFGARMQCASSKLADAVDTECHRERCSIIIGKNGHFLKSVHFPLNVGIRLKTVNGQFWRMSISSGLVWMERCSGINTTRFWYLRCMQWRSRRRSACFMNDSGAVAYDDRFIDRPLQRDQGICQKNDAGNL